MTDEIQLSRRKALAGLGGIGLASAGAGAGTLAYFSDTETVEDNRIEAGSLEISVTDGHTISYTYRNVAPGADQDADGYDLVFSVDVANAGSVAAETTALYVENATSGASGMAQYLLIDEFWYANETYVSGGSATSTGSNVFGASGEVSLADIADQTVTLGPTHEPGDDLTFHYELTVSEEMGNEFQGAELETTLHFALLQSEEQEWSPSG